MIYLLSVYCIRIFMYYISIVYVYTIYVRTYEHRSKPSTFSSCIYCTKLARRTVIWSRPAPNCDDIIYVGNVELVWERPQNDLCRMNTHFHNTYMNDIILGDFLYAWNRLSWYFYALDFRKNIPTPERPQNDVRKFKQVPPHHLGPTVLTKHEFVATWCPKRALIEIDDQGALIHVA